MPAGVPGASGVGNETKAGTGASGEGGEASGGSSELEPAPSSKGKPPAPSSSSASSSGATSSRRSWFLWGGGGNTKVTPQEDTKAKGGAPKGSSSNSNGNGVDPRNGTVGSGNTGGVPQGLEGAPGGSEAASDRGLGAGAKAGDGGGGVTPSPSLDDVSEEHARAGVAELQGRRSSSAPSFGDTSKVQVRTHLFFQVRLQYCVLCAVRTVQQYSGVPALHVLCMEHIL